MRKVPPVSISARMTLSVTKPRSRATLVPRKLPLASGAEPRVPGWVMTSLPFRPQVFAVMSLTASTWSSSPEALAITRRSTALTKAALVLVLPPKLRTVTVPFAPTVNWFSNAAVDSSQPWIAARLAVWLGAPRMMAVVTSGNSPLTWNCALMSPSVLMPTAPTELMRRRSMALVRAMMVLSPPALMEISPPDTAGLVVSAKVPALRTLGVVTEVPATTVVNAPAARVVWPMAVPSIEPPVSATSALWN